MKQDDFSAAVSYSLGAVIGNNLKNQVLAEDINISQLALGLQDALQGEELSIPLQQAAQIVQHYFQKVVANQSAAAEEEQIKFLAENAQREGITALASGLQYEVLRAGNGPIPKAKDTVVAHYEGRLLDGTVFDSSIRRGEPATFPVNALIQGWQEALQLMPTGSRWRLYIPYELGYGEQGAGADIPPFSTLIFDLELLQIV
jgi:FKBP-type peptidyl-prolyl cis-trans isomerase FklB